ncbi:MAG TPA: hypothetical protein VLT85_08900, partial [Terriglobales bacterium]|nr:hypothetical protein [Terriglobales bacterium]
PQWAAQWLERRPGPASCGAAIQRANIFRDAGLVDRATQALAECKSSEEWVKRCVRFISQESPAAR